MSPCIVVFNLNNPKFGGSPGWERGEKMAFNFTHIFFATNEHLKYGARLQGSLWRLTFSHTAAPCHHTWCPLYLAPDVFECVCMLNAFWHIWWGTSSVTKQSKPFLRKCPTIMRYFLYMPLLPLICSERFFLTHIHKHQARNQHIQYVIYIFFQCSLC